MAKVELKAPIVDEIKGYVADAKAAVLVDYQFCVKPIHIISPPLLRCQTTAEQIAWRNNTDHKNPSFCKFSLLNLFKNLSYSSASTSSHVLTASSKFSNLPR